LFKEVCLVVDRYRQLGPIEHDRTCSDSLIATLNVNYNNTAFDGDGSVASVEFESNTNNSKYVGAVSEYFTSTRSEISKALGNNGAIMSFMITYVVGAIMIFNPATFVWGTILGFLASFTLGFVTASFTTTLLTVIILGGIIALRLNT
jgi:hypothetical protein